MNILVLNPPFKPELGKFSRTSRSPTVTKGGTLYYPFWLASTVGVLEKDGFNVMFLDAVADKLTNYEILHKIRHFSPSLIVIGTSTPSINSDVKFAESIKQHLPHTHINLVGTHPSALPLETMELSNSIDSVCIGEYDYTVRDLARAISESIRKNTQPFNMIKNVNGIYYKLDRMIFETKPRQRIENLDKLPFVTKVYKKHLNVKNYFFAAAQYPMVMIITGRGCPFRCTFCNYPQTFHGRRYRMRSPENIVHEFEYIIKNLPEVKEIGIEDDTFTADRKRVREVCELIIDRNIKIDWYCNVRADLDLKTMKIMKKAGCRLLTVGFESGSQEILNNIHKGITIKQIHNFVSDSKKAKLLVHGCFVIGLPGETYETLEQSLKLSKELNCDTMQFYPVQVYPGTELYDWANNKGYLFTKDFSKWVTKDGQVSTTINLPNLSREELVGFCDKAFREYYIRPKYIFYKIKMLIMKPKEIPRTIMSFKTFYKNLIKTTRLEK